MTYEVPDNTSSDDAGSATEEDEDDMRARYRRYHETASTAGDTQRIPPLSLEELRTWLYLSRILFSIYIYFVFDDTKRYVAKFRHSIPHVAKGWTFGSLGTETPACQAHIDSLGRRMYRAMYERR